MSIEADFRTTLTAHAPLTALIGSRLALNALPDDADMARIITELGLDQPPVNPDPGEAPVSPW